MKPSFTCSMKSLKTFAGFLVLRLLSIHLVQTWFVPDEYWQSLEVAHNITFGYGYLTWEWILGIRSYVYPLIFALFYKFLQIWHWDFAEAIIYLPRILQASLSAYADLRFCQHMRSSRWSKFVIGVSWFWFYTASRTLINTFETALTTIAFSYFPWKAGDSSKNTFLWIVAFLCLIRPTAAIQWLPLCAYHLYISKEGFLTIILKRYLPIGLVALVVTTLLDSFAHGSFIVTSYEFLKLNIFENVGEWYGTEPWYWYLVNGFPVVVGIPHCVLLPLAAYTFIKGKSKFANELAVLGSIVFTLMVYSFLPHKEFRFILPLLPMTLSLTSKYLSIQSRNWSELRLYVLATIIIVYEVCVGGCLLHHQRGALDVMVPLREIAEKSPDKTSFLFLMPCHSTPLYSHLHVNVSTRFLTCEPNLAKVENYTDEADQFYKRPNMWLSEHYPSEGALPSHIITFDRLSSLTVDMLIRYRPIQTIFHRYPLLTIPIGEYTLFKETKDVRRGENMIIHARNDLVTWSDI